MILTKSQYSLYKRKSELPRVDSGIQCRAYTDILWDEEFDYEPKPEWAPLETSLNFFVEN